MHSNPTWLIPSFHGDIRLTAKGPKETHLHAFELTGSEEQAMEQLRKRALSPGFTQTAWATDKDFRPLTNSAYRTKDGIEITLRAKLDDVHKVLAKALKPGRELVMVLRAGDAIQEVTVADAAAKPEPKPDAKEKPAVGVTVAVPDRGCPMPDFPEADIRASRVLEAFLMPDQIADYRARGAFVTRGADTGTRYLVCNRERPALMRAQLGGRQLFNLDRNAAICVHDWAVPPPEEMLALHLCLSIPGRETKLLCLPEIDPELAMQDVDPRYRPRN
jgi:hypothetical protein